MSALTNLALLAAAAAGTYYFVEVRPKARKKKKKGLGGAPVTGTPPGFTPIVSIEEAIAAQTQVIQEKKPWLAVEVRKRSGQAWIKLRPILAELAVAYPQVAFFEFDADKIRAEPPRADVAIVNVGFNWSLVKAEGVTVLLSASGSPSSLLEETGEEISTAFNQIVEQNLTAPDEVVNLLVQAVEAAIEIAKEPQPPMPPGLEPPPPPPGEPGGITAASFPSALGFFL